jgi:hypothetical protein
MKTHTFNVSVRQMPPIQIDGLVENDTEAIRNDRVEKSQHANTTQRSHDD